MEKLPPQQLSLLVLATFATMQRPPVEVSSFPADNGDISWEEHHRKNRAALAPDWSMQEYSRRVVDWLQSDEVVASLSSL